MNLPFFSPDPVSARELLLIGYQLFPRGRIPLHPRLTVLSGNNGVGKTTLLDAIQTVILCHQHYISMNVASGQNDRSIIGQLRQRVAWTAIGIGGHETVTALGVRLFVRPSGEQLELAPFVLKHAALTESLFLDPATNEITPDLSALGRNVLRADPGAECLPFDRVDDYHSFLFEQGILPIPLMRKGKKKTFANLWRQITQPRLNDLQAFLQDMLCPPPSRRTNFSDVEKLMRDRRGVEERLRGLVRFRQTRQTLDGLRGALDMARRASLRGDLAIGIEREAAVRQALERNGVELEKTQRLLTDRIAGLANQERDERALLDQRDLCQKQQSSLAVQLRHHKEYQEAGRVLQQAMEQLRAAEGELSRLVAELVPVVEGMAAVGEQQTRLLLEKERLGARRELLEKETATWTAFQCELEKAAGILERPVRTKADVIELWATWDKPYREQLLLSEWRGQLPDLRRRATAHLEALESWRALARDHGLPEAFEREAVERLQADARRNIRDKVLKLDAMNQRQARLVDLRQTLAKGRPPLPEAARRMVENGLAEPVAQDFDELEVDRAAVWQKRLGPFALAIRPAPGVDPLEHLAGPDRVFLVSGPVDRAAWSGTNADLGGFGNLGWYEPDGPVWLSSRARVQQLGLLETQLRELDAAQARIREDTTALELCEKRCAALVGAWAALEDRDAVTREEELARRIERVAMNQPRVKTCFECVNRLKQHLHVFELEECPRQLKTVRERLADIENEARALAAEDSRLRALRHEAEARRKELEQAVHVQDKIREGAEVRRRQLEQEEPGDVLEGRVDFARAEDMAGRILALDRKLEALRREIGEANQLVGQNRSEIGNLAASGAALRSKQAHAAEDLERAQAAWRGQYGDEMPGITPRDREESRRNAARREWDEARGELIKTLEHVCQEYGQPMSLSRDQEPDRFVEDVLRMLIPPDLELDREEEKLESLRAELAQIEKKLRGYVEEIRRNVDLDMQGLTRRLLRINDILSNLGFGKVRKVYLEKVLEPVYEGLKHLRGSGQLPLFSSGGITGLREFLDQIREIIARHSRGTQLEDDQITDYRSYVRLTWAIEDDQGRERRSGFSSGEGLGINLAICLSLLFYEGSEAGRQRGSGFLLMALDEAERLDERAMNTVRDLLDRVECQLVLALPRMLNIPDSLTHILTPLPQGVTHVGVYHAPAVVGEQPVEA
ncbi:MAG: hypothetical protein EOL86_10135 [Deltaproteobacteria bacterium]|nr:hypothetical protein [Deltaproteobacteria bacterium]